MLFIFYSFMLMLTLVIGVGCSSLRKAPTPEYLPPAEVIQTGKPKPPATLSGTLPPPPMRRPIVSAEQVPVVTPTFREILAGQILLDRRNISCNCVDGIMGEQSRMALKAWQNQTGLPANGEFDGPTLKKLGDLETAFTTHRVTTNEVASLTPVPKTWVGKSEVEYLGYETILELVAEKYHATESVIKELNPGVSWPDPAPGTVLEVPNPMPNKKPKAARLRIDLGRKLLRAYDSKGRLVAQFPCSIAEEVDKRPEGTLKVVNCASFPVYMFDPDVFKESDEAKSIHSRLLIPPGPNNPVGVAWISLDRPGYGIHGTPRPEDIGQTGSHGCFRLANWNAEKLLNMISVGIPVIVEP